MLAVEQGRLSSYGYRASAHHPDLSLLAIPRHHQDFTPDLSLLAIPRHHQDFTPDLALLAIPRRQPPA